MGSRKNRELDKLFDSCESDPEAQFLYDKLYKDITVAYGAVGDINRHMLKDKKHSFNREHLSKEEYSKNNSQMENPSKIENKIILI